MSVDIGLLPSGHLHCFPSTTDSDSNESAGNARIAKAFSRHTGEGLFTLAARREDTDLAPAFVYWRNFAGKYLGARCLLTPTDPGRIDPLEPLCAADITPLLLNVPPMRGAEYLSARALQEIWTLLDRWVCEQIHAFGSLAGFLASKAPQWHQVGRVCFHLAENKNDPDYPFAFMATYVPEISGQGRVRYQPLNRALQEYAGAKNKQALIRLLSPVHRASESSPVIRDLVETGDRISYRLENNNPAFYPHSARWELGITDELNLELKVNNGAGEMFLDLEELNLYSLDANQGVGRLVIRLPKAAAEEVLIDQAIGTIHIQIPANVRVTVDAQNGLSRVDFPPDFELKNGVYSSPGATKTNSEISITVEQAIGYITFEYQK